MSIKTDTPEHYRLRIGTLDTPLQQNQACIFSLHLKRNGTASLMIYHNTLSVLKVVFNYDFETANLQANEIYRLLNGGVTPRPIAWISTLSVDGVANLAPYSFSMWQAVTCRSFGIHK